MTPVIFLFESGENLPLHRPEDQFPGSTHQNSTPFEPEERQSPHNIRELGVQPPGIREHSLEVHAFFTFPETAIKPLEEAEEIFDDSTSAKKTHVSTYVRMVERGEADTEEKFGRVDQKLWW
ncbi:hypothetical protein BGZ60DRAFT_431462 [Tricladium varicosporioides]|nr:hypothetical protein BGZ60DRAFT_431462 [Hymenoscyphus varicosporioides]